MVLSVWRYSHLLLAIVGGLFIFIASLTGIILAFEPISNKTDDYFVKASEQLTLAQTIDVLQTKHSEVVSITVDENNYILANLTTTDAGSGEFYVNPLTGQILGKPKQKAKIFEFATNLHRSLFLKSTGRLLVGLVSFILLLIAITGCILIIKRQGGVRKLFSKVVFEKASQYYHVVLSRLSFVPIVIITLTGVVLSLDRFSVLPSNNLEHTGTTLEAALEKIPAKDFEVFTHYGILDISSLEFPFSPFEEDYFILKTPTEELYINQIHGGVISKASVSYLSQIVDWSLFLHTGQGSILWAIVLGVSCIVLIVLMFTGYRIALSRVKNTKKFSNTFTADEAEYILLVGSETGTTFSFAYRFAEAMLEAKQSIYVGALDAYTSYAKAKHLIVFTATYGEGESPSNSELFLEQLKSSRPLSKLEYCVLGFGSLLYPEYCQFAIDVNAALQAKENFIETLPLFKINNQSEEAFKSWVTQWNKNQSYDITIKPLLKTIKGLSTFRVANISKLNGDDTYLISLVPTQKMKFTSGDLLAFYPEEDMIERQYSVAKVGNEILLSIKRHEFGICSNYLFHQTPENLVRARLKTNSDFHMPTSAKEVMMISNGTGIAPFLGMINEKTSPVKHLFWGGRTQESYDLYATYISKALDKGILTSFQMALSRDPKDGRYVQDLLLEQKELIVKVLSNGGVIMICGAIAMQNQVLDLLEELSKSRLERPLSDFENNDQLKMDCY